jgi:hypothetical protein
MTGETQYVEGYLVEAQTFEGLSGAHVFQREMVALRGIFPEHNGGPVVAATGLQLLGVYSGAWEGEPSESLRNDRKWIPNRRIPAGMGIVAPGERILEIVLADPELKRLRAEIHKQRRQYSTASPVVDSPPRDEEFTSLQNAATPVPGAGTQ